MIRDIANSILLLYSNITRSYVHIIWRLVSVEFTLRSLHRDISVAVLLSQVLLCTSLTILISERVIIFGPCLFMKTSNTNLGLRSLVALLRHDPYE